MAIFHQNEVFRVMFCWLEVNEEARRWMGRFLDVESPPTWLLSHSSEMVLIDVSRDPNSANLMNKLRFYLFMDLHGMGPDWYCVRFRPLHFEFVNYLTQVLANLPRSKIFLYPFDPWFNNDAFSREMRIQLRVLLRQPSITKNEYLAKFGELAPASFAFAGWVHSLSR